MKRIALLIFTMLVVAFICGFIACGTAGNDDTDIDNDIEMVWIPSGNFIMGSNTAETAAPCIDPRPTRTVYLTTGFYIGKYEITQAQYKAVMGINPSYFKGDKLPVENVSWYDAVEFCNKLSVLKGLTEAYLIEKDISDPNNENTSLFDPKWKVTLITGADGYRLPTEAQWEYACRAGTTTNYNTGMDSISNETGWYKANSDGKTHEIGKKTPNAWGIYDMHGNVWEWCWDWVNLGGDNYYVFAPDPDYDPVGLSSGNHRAERGGGWNHSPNRLNSAYRERYQPQAKIEDLGFRVVCPQAMANKNEEL